MKTYEGWSMAEGGEVGLDVRRDWHAMPEAEVLAALSSSRNTSEAFS